jgi:ABC-2 type transport system permease protein
MSSTIVIKEMRALLRDGRLWVLGLALAVLLLALLATARQSRSAAEQERQQAETASRAQWDQQGERNPHRAAHFGLYAFKPQSALAAIAPGIDAQAGQTLWLEPHKRNMALHAAAADAPPSLGLGESHPGFVLAALLPLLIVVLGHGLVTQERERGTLRMLQACGVRAGPLLLGKWLGLCTGLGLVLAPVLALGAWIVVDGPATGAAALLGLALLLHCAVWAALAVLVSALCRQSRTALLALLALWVAAVFVVPRWGAATVERLRPLPTGEAFWAAIRQDIEHGLPGDGNAKQRMAAFDARLLAEHGVARLEELPIGANASRRLHRDAYATRIHALHFDRLWQAQLAQQQLLRGLTAISPHALMRAASSALAGTDLAHRRHFEDAAEHYRQRFTTLVDAWDRQATRGVTSAESRYAGNAVWQSIPPWTYAPPGLGFALRAAAADLLLLAAWLAASLAALWVSARRLKP